MKANEAPEKIYFSGQQQWSNPFIGLMQKVSDTDIEYIRTDVFVEKACELLVNCIEDFMLRRMEIWDEECKKQTLENLRNALLKK